MKKEHFTYLLARLPIAISFFGHGLVRLSKLSTFSGWMVGQFGKSILAPGFITPFAYTLPFLEFLIGILLLLGLFTRFACALGVLVMSALIFGSCMIEQWNNVVVQMFYGAYLAALYYYANKNKYAIDGILKRSAE